MKTYGVQMLVDIVVGDFESPESFNEYWGKLTEAERIDKIRESESTNILQERVWRA